MDNMPRNAPGGLVEGKAPQAAVFSRLTCGGLSKDAQGLQAINGGLRAGGMVLRRLLPWPGGRYHPGLLVPSLFRLAPHRDEPHGGNRLAADASVLLLLDHEKLLEETAHRNDQPAAAGELVHQGLGYMVRRSGHDDYVEWCLLGPSPISADPRALRADAGLRRSGHGRRPRKRHGHRRRCGPEEHAARAAVAGSQFSFGCVQGAGDVPHRRAGGPLRVE